VGLVWDWCGVGVRLWAITGEGKASTRTLVLMSTCHLKANGASIYEILEFWNDHIFLIVASFLKILSLS